jgi:signal peptidase I
VEANLPGHPTAIDPAFVGRVLRDLLEDGAPVQIQVTGLSMVPFIRAGDLVTLVPAAKRSARIGDVIAYGRSAAKFRLHRVVGRSRETLVPRGDGAAAPDQPITLEDVIGRVTHVERTGRRVWLGLGPERVLIALLSRLGLLVPLLRFYEKLRRRPG